MNLSLTTGLAIVAGLVLIAIVVHGAWQARKAEPRQPDPVPGKSRQDPTLVDDTLVEPDDVTETLPPPVSSPGNSPSVATKPSALAGNGLLAEVQAAAPRHGQGIDSLLDIVAGVLPGMPVSGDMALQHWAGTRHIGTKPVALEGLNKTNDRWETPRPGQRYRRFQIGLQMANRHGAVTAIEYSDFVHKVQMFAENIGAASEFPDMQVALKRGRELDQFAQSHDAQLTAHLRSNSSPWSLGYVEQCAARLGFIPAAVAGRLQMPSAEEGAPPVLVLSFSPQAALADTPEQAVLHEVLLSLDVAQTAESAEPFATWQQVARQLTQVMGASLLDDQGHVISLHGFTAIHQDLNRLYAALRDQQFPAGSPAARRLFS